MGGHCLIDSQKWPFKTGCHVGAAGTVTGSFKNESIGFIFKTESNPNRLGEMPREAQIEEGAIKAGKNRRYMDVLIKSGQPNAVGLTLAQQALERPLNQPGAFYRNHRARRSYRSMDNE